MFQKSVLMSLAIVGLSFSVANADDGATTTRLSVAKREAVKLDSTPSASIARPVTAQELIQARAWNRHLQRQARLDANAWAGYDPLRPALPANPYTQPAYPVYRPMHIWSVYDYVRFN
jgi:hypothetical protein